MALLVLCIMTRNIKNRMFSTTLLKVASYLCLLAIAITGPVSMLSCGTQMQRFMPILSCSVCFSILCKLLVLLYLSLCSFLQHCLCSYDIFVIDMMYMIINYVDLSLVLLSSIPNMSFFYFLDRHFYAYLVKVIS